MFLLCSYKCQYQITLINLLFDTYTHFNHPVCTSKHSQIFTHAITRTYAAVMTASGAAHAQWTRRVWRHCSEPSGSRESHFDVCHVSRHVCCCHMIYLHVCCAWHDLFPSPTSCCAGINVLHIIDIVCQFMALNIKWPRWSWRLTRSINTVPLWFHSKRS